MKTLLVLAILILVSCWFSIGYAWGKEDADKWYAMHPPKCRLSDVLDPDTRMTWHNGTPVYYVPEPSLQ